MDAFVRALISTTPINQRTLISNSPQPAILIWSNATSMPQLTGITITSKLGIDYWGLDVALLVNALRAALPQTPILDIHYDPQMLFMDINGIRFTSLLAAANHISNSLNVPLGPNPAKIPNNVERITDPFHIWSRDAFDGDTVVKTDLDAIVMNANHTMITSIVEIKRSRAVPVGRWLPYFDDEPNYLLTMDLCNKLNVRLITVHHEELSNTTAINPLFNIDVFTYYPIQTTPTNQTFINFRRSIRNVTNFQNLFPTL